MRRRSFRLDITNRLAAKFVRGGAKDPIQKDANQRAWLVNQLAPLAGDCALHLMGHVHTLLVQPPARTAGELLDRLERDFQGKDLVHEERMKAVERGRQRRSKRPARHAA